ncbi:MAG: hypothetical protein ACRDTT_16070 [Pseudonocardiaceae bacterium]
MFAVNVDPELINTARSRQARLGYPTLAAIDGAAGTIEGGHERVNSALCLTEVKKIASWWQSRKAWGCLVVVATRGRAKVQP